MIFTMKIKLTTAFFAFFILFNAVCYAQTKDETAIKNVLQTQEVAWNTGRVDDFMKGYWKSDSLMFVGKSGITYGWQKTLDNYKKNYPDAAAMGTLTFTLLELKPLSPKYYFVIGKWNLIRTAGNIGGYFSLLFKKIEGEWLIICDHTS
jgi:ketosteroid isomerase-like protein